MKNITINEFNNLPSIFKFGKNFPNEENEQWGVEVNPIAIAFKEILPELLRTESYEERGNMLSDAGAKLLFENEKYFIIFKLPTKFAKTYGSAFWISPSAVSNPKYACMWVFALMHYLTPEFC
jgi:hypothetical protein